MVGSHEWTLKSGISYEYDALGRRMHTYNTAGGFGKGTKTFKDRYPMSEATESLG